MHSWYAWFCTSRFYYPVISLGQIGKSKSKFVQYCNIYAWACNLISENKNHGTWVRGWRQLLQVGFEAWTPDLLHAWHLAHILNVAVAVAVFNINTTTMSFIPTIWVVYMNQKRELRWIKHMNLRCPLITVERYVFIKAFDIHFYSNIYIYFFALNSCIWLANIILMQNCDR